MFMFELGASSLLGVSVIVHTPPVQPGSVFGIANVMVLVSPFALAAAIASRKLQSLSQVPSSVSSVLVTTKFIFEFVIVQVFTSPAASVIVPSAAQSPLITLV